MIRLNQTIGLIIIKLLFFSIIVRYKSAMSRDCIEKISCSQFYISQNSLGFALIEMCFGLIKIK